jgi:chorismate dehydratase
VVKLRNDMISTNSIARIGMVNYINTAPIYEVWKESVNNEALIVFEDTPAMLNKMLAAGSIDLGFVSSVEYSVNPTQYRILGDLSISASGPVGSVFLFSEIPIGELSDAVILLSNQSETSSCLLKIILEEFYSLRPRYIRGKVDEENLFKSQAVMAIGDQALRLVASGRYPFKLDLGEIWYNHIGLPFVFSVCAVREEFCENSPELVETVHRELLRCRDEGQRNLRKLCQYVAPRIPMEIEKCYAYLTALEFDLGERKIEALNRFFKYLIDRGEAEPETLPLKIIDENRKQGE